MEAQVQAVDLLGSQVSHYSIVGLIGAGGMGRVYRARDRRLRRDVAIKVLKSEPSMTPPRRSGLIDEARALSRFSHPHVAGIYDFVTESGRDFIVMEFVSGATLKEIVASGPLPLEEVVRLGTQMLAGLNAAHTARIVHRDIKPANLKVTSSGELKILDFGLAAPMPWSGPYEGTSDTSAALWPAGTLAYMAPEQLLGEPIDERSDIFSAGAVLYEMASGTPAFPQRQIARLFDAILHEDPPPLTAVNPFVPLALERVVMEAIAKNPMDRQASAAELSEALVALTGGNRGREAAVARRHDGWWTRLTVW